MKLHADTALLPTGWADQVTVTVADGAIAGVVTGPCPADAVRVRGPLLPGVPNLHSHAFQRAMVGLTEKAAGADDFWSWRQTMYGFVERLTPEILGQLAQRLYVDMLKAGYTSVAEFHYVHHQPGGVPYGDPALMSRMLIEAARAAGIGLTLLPVLYVQGGFGGTPVGPAQSRFHCGPETFAGLVQGLAAAVAGDPDLGLGIAPHSLRAVAPEHLDAALAAAPAGGPVHIHVAEQTREVEDCLVWCGRRPVRFLLDRFPVDERWCLVHATHVEPDEVADMAARGAIAGLCPTTEADLGDGLFPVGAFVDRGGRLGVGSDSQVTVDPAAELRLLEWGQRLVLRKRGVLGGHRVPSVGGRLLRLALEGGAGACGRPVGRIAVGSRADLVALDGGHPLLWGKRGDDIADAWVFGGGPAMVRDVWVGGRAVIAEGRHAQDDAIDAGWRQAMAALTA